uniref:Uncharacterized protein n=1 Tax=viral metagenome TaxID=1070528 RepID=A0A6M3LPC9_9ZZZZ
MARINITPEQFAEKHARRLTGALEDMRRGVEAVTEAPGKRAAAKADKMRAGIVRSLDDGTWARRVGAVTLEEWKRSMLDKGLNRVAAGVEGSRDKVQAFATQLLAHEATLQDTVTKMPDLTLEDSVARMTAWVRGMAKFEFKR